MNNLFVSLNLSEKLKELGFNEPCFGWYRCYSKDSVYLEYNTMHNTNLDSLDIYTNKNCTPAPLYQQALDWLRENFDIFIEICRTEANKTYQFDLMIGHSCQYLLQTQYKDYYECLNMAILEAIKEIK